MTLHDPNRFRVGTLIYSRAGLVTLFSWLLWGDFVYTLVAGCFLLLRGLWRMGDIPGMESVGRNRL